MKRAPDFSALPAWGKDKRRLTKLAGDSLAFDTQSDALIDTEAMAATAVISTPTPDRVNDSVNPNGVQLENYRKNPVVLWEHGFSGISMPIGKAEDPDGRLSIAKSEAAVLGTTYFTNKFLEAEQIFELIVERFIRATSIRLNPIKSNIRRDDEEEVFDIEEWDLEEFSWCCIPCNPEAVNGLVAKNRLAGRQIAAPIMKSLQLWLPERGVIVPGWRPEPEGKNVAKTSTNKPNTKATKATDDDPEKPADEGGAGGDAGGKPADDTPADDPKEPKAEPAQKPLGAQMAMSAFGMANSVMAALEQDIGLLEQPDMKAALEEYLTAMKGCQSILQDAYSKVYGEQMAEPTDEDTEAMKSYLATSQAGRLLLAGISQNLKSLAAAKNILPAQKISLQTLAKQADSMVTKAKATKPADAPAGATQPNTQDGSIQKQIEQLTNDFNAMAKTLSDIRPHRAVA